MNQQNMLRVTVLCRNYLFLLLNLLCCDRQKNEDHRGRDRMVAGFITTCAISAHHRYRCEFESRSDDVYSIQHYVIKFVSDLRQVFGFLRILRFPPSIKLTATI